MKPVTYPRQLEIFDKEGKKVSAVYTQLYKIGVYCAIYDYTSTKQVPTQLSFKPKQIKKFMRDCTKFETDRGNTVKPGTDITVYEDDSGFYKEQTV